MSRLAFALGAVLLCGCSAFGLEDAVADKVVEDQSKIASYEGTISELGTVPGKPLEPVVSRVRWVAPSSLVVEVVSPERYKGDTFAWIGSTVHVYSAELNAGVRVRNMPTPTATTWRALVQETTRYNFKNYGFREEEPETTAGRRTIPWRVTPRDSGDLRVRSRWWMDAAFSFPLGVAMQRPEGAGELYRLDFQSVDFNGKLAAANLAWQPSESATWADWDMSRPSLSLEDAKKRIDFSLLEAKGEVFGLARTRIVPASSNVIPGVALVYERGPFFVTVSENKDRGFQANDARGVPVALDGDAGRLTFVGSTSILVFSRKGVQVTLVSNVPLPELVKLARSLE